MTDKLLNAFPLPWRVDQQHFDLTNGESILIGCEVLDAVGRMVFYCGAECNLSVNQLLDLVELVNAGGKP